MQSRFAGFIWHGPYFNDDWPLVHLGRSASPLHSVSPSSKAAYVQALKAFKEQLAKLNAFETFPGFAAAVLVAHFTQVLQLRIDAVALAFILFRILNTSFYIINKPNLRNLS